MVSDIKKFSALIILSFVFLIPKISSAQLLHNYKLDASASGTVITATLSGVEPANRDQMKIFAQTTNFTPGVPACSSLFPCPQPTKEILADGTIKWTIKNGIAGATIYNVRAEGDNAGIVQGYISEVKQVTTGGTTIDAAWPLTVVTDGSSAYISGVIHNVNPSGFKATLQYSHDALPADETSPPGASAVIESQKDPGHVDQGINTNGSYGFRINGLSSNTTYAFRQIIKSPDGVKEIKVGSFNSKTGMILEGSPDQAQSFDQRSYKLLAPLPGLDIILDNDLCREQITQGKRPAGSCDNQISDFINLLIKILIGLSAVVLVIQLIIQGYTYMVTDTPFRMASAKSRFFDALFGLLLAMAAYLILNTINPKLVSSDFNVAGIDIGVTEYKFSGYREVYIDKNGTKTKVDSIKLKDMIPYAQKAEQKTGIKAAQILGILWVETNFNASDGTCYWKQPGVMPPDPGRTSNRDDEASFARLMASLGRNPDTRTVSCALSSTTWGGAMGPSQHIPTSWDGVSERIKVASGKSTADPWDLQDALYALGFTLADGGGKSNIENAVCKYYSGHNCGASQPGDSGRYGNLAYRDKFLGAVSDIQSKMGGSTNTGNNTNNGGGSKSILAIGDSITQDTSSYIDQFKSSHTGWSIKKVAQFGQKTDWMLTSIQSEKNQGNTYGVITILGGTNDVYSGTSISTTESNINNIVQIAKTMAPKVVVISPPADIFNTNPGAYTSSNPTDSSKQQKFSSLRTYESSLPGISYIDFYSLTSSSASLFKDKIHPTAAAHALLQTSFASKVQ